MRGIQSSQQYVNPFTVGNFISPNTQAQIGPEINMPNIQAQVRTNTEPEYNLYTNFLNSQVPNNPFTSKVPTEASQVPTDPFIINMPDQRSQVPIDPFISNVPNQASQVLIDPFISNMPNQASMPHVNNPIGLQEDSAIDYGVLLNIVNQGHNQETDNPIQSGGIIASSQEPKRKRAMRTADTVAAEEAEILNTKRARITRVWES